MDDEGAISTPLLGSLDAELIGQVQELFRDASRQIRSRLVNRAGADVRVRFGSAEATNLGAVRELMMGKEGGVFAWFRVQPFDVPCLMIIEGATLYRLVGLFLGEAPDAEAPLYRWRALTRVDLRIARRIVEDTLLGLHVCLPAPVTGVSIELLSANPRMSVPLAPNTMLVDATLDLGPPDDAYGLMSIILPAQVITALWPKTDRSRLDEKGRRGFARVLPLPVDVVAELGRVQLSLSQVRRLAVGSMLDLGAIGDVQLRVGDRAAYTADAGEVAGRRCVRVKRRLVGALQLPGPSGVEQLARR